MIVICAELKCVWCEKEIDHGYVEVLGSPMHDQCEFKFRLECAKWSESEDEELPLEDDEEYDPWQSQQEDDDIPYCDEVDEEVDEEVDDE